MGKFSEALEKSEKERSNNIRRKSSAITKQQNTDKNKRSDIIRNECNSNLIVLNQPHSFEAEQFRALKTNLLFSKDEQPPKSIMVTSAAPDEGKSFVASNLAVTFAQSVDKHVLLMDCDLRLPTVHTIFGLNDDTPGLSNLLKGEIEVPDALYRSQIDKLTIIPGGKQPHNPTELLSSLRMTNLLEEVKTRYDDRYIIIDSPPPTLTAETLALSRQVDGILIVVRHESTNRKAVKEMIDHLERDKIIGVVVNRYDVRLAKYYGYGNYGSYYGPS